MTFPLRWQVTELLLRLWAIPKLKHTCLERRSLIFYLYLSIFLILLTEEIKDSNLEIEKVYLRHQPPYGISEYITLLLKKMVRAYQHSKLAIFHLLVRDKIPSSVLSSGVLCSVFPQYKNDMEL